LSHKKTGYIIFQMVEMERDCIPGLYPKEIDLKDLNESERTVYEKLSDALPPNWYAWHSLRLRSIKGEDIEIDFVIADPNQGILVAEVKGGFLSKQNGKWYQNQKIIQSPSRQALKCKYALIDKYKEKYMLAPPIHYILFFPDTDIPTQPTQGDMEGLVIGAREIPYLKESIENLMTQSLPKNLKKKPTKGWIKFIYDLWCNQWIPEMNLSCRTKKEIERRIKLDRYQFDSLCNALENDKVLVKGGAGTGKTLLARELAKKEGKEGKKVLLFTFTEALGKELASHLDNPNIISTSIGKFALDLLRKDGFKEKEVYTPNFWNKVTKKATNRRIKKKLKQMDNVIIDEAQDMGKNEWKIIFNCANKKKRIWAFYDPSQTFLENRIMSKKFLKNCMKYELRKPYRCPLGIQELSDGYLGKEIDLELVKKEISDKTIKIIKSDESRIHCNIGDEINLLLEDGFKKSEIAILSLRGRNFKDNVMHKNTLGGHKIIEATDEDLEECIICDTFLRYKGLERPAIIVTDLRFVSDNYNTRMSIAISRAMGVLRIIGEKREIEKDGILNKLRYYGEI